MVDLGSIGFHIDVPSMPEADLKDYTIRLFDLWEAQVQEVVRIPDFALSLQIEEGSINGKAGVAGTLLALYIGIAQYGSFISGVQTIKGQLDHAYTYLTKIAHSSHGASRGPMSVKKRHGTLTRLERLFAEVQRGKISVSDAMHQAEILLGEESHQVPNFLRIMEKALINAPLVPEQRLLPMVEIEQVEDPSEEHGPPRPKKSRPFPICPPSLHLRVEVWRESKRGKRNIKITQL